MTKEEYYQVLISGKISAAYYDMDDAEEEKLSRELMETVPFNTVIPAIENRVLESALSETDDTVLAVALKFATEQTKEKVFSVLSAGKTKEIKKLFEFIGPQIFRVIIENQEKIIEKMKGVPC